VFDFLGADHEQIEHFKRGFGGELLHGFKISSQPGFPLSWLLNLREQVHKRKRNLL
jgi:hypothetical protein